MRCLVNNTEQEQPDDRDDTLIKLFGRTADEPQEVQEITVHGFDPYCYGEESEVREKENQLLAQDCVDRVEYGDFDAFPDDQDLAKIYTPKPQDVPSVKDFLTETWNADVPFTNRFRVDTGIRDVVEVPDDAGQNGQYRVHWREIEPVVPPSSGPECGV